MSKNVEEFFREEVRKRGYVKKEHPGLKIALSLLLIPVTIGISNFIFQGYSEDSNTKSHSNISEENIDNSSRKPKLIPVTLPNTGILKKYNFKPNENFGLLRFFLRAPLKSEKSPLPATCGKNNILGDIQNQDNHRFIELVDWQSDEIITSAFVRDGEMIEIFVPLGSYKLRYAIGSEWYGEKEMFGSEYMYEMTEQFSSKAAILEFTIENSGHEIGAYCSNGNLGKKRIKKDLSKKSLPLSGTDKI